MKRFILMFVVLGAFSFAQEEEGLYQLSGVNVQYYVFTRPNAADADVIGITADGHHLAQQGPEGSSIITVTEPITGTVLAISEIPAGVVIGDFVQDHYGLAVLQASGVNLNFAFGEDNVPEEYQGGGVNGMITQGSYYPTQQIVDGTCETLLEVVAIIDPLIYEADLVDTRTAAPANVLGLPSIFSYAGQDVGKFALSQSVVFPYMGLDGDYVDAPFPVVLPDGTLLALPYAADLDGDGVGDGWGYPYPNTASLLKGDLITHGSFADGHPGNAGQPNPAPGLVLHWNTVDSEASETGMGDILTGDDWDEDGDGTIWDQLYGYAALDATPLSAACGFTHPALGDVAYALHGAGLEGCIENPDFVYHTDENGNVVNITNNNLVSVNDAYLLDAALAPWGNFLTMNGLLFQGYNGACLAAGGAGPLAFDSCVDTATGDELQYGCESFGVTASFTQACIDAGGPATVEESMAMGLNGLTCGDLAAQYDYASGGDCATATLYATSTCEASNGSSLCCLAQSIATAGIEDLDGDGSDCGEFVTSLGYAANDSDHDFDGVDGRLPVHFDPTCVPTLQTLEVEVEAQIVAGFCDNNGDINGDSITNVLDVVQIVGHVLSTVELSDDQLCAADVNADDIVNVLDVVTIVQQILSGGLSQATGASSVDFIQTGNSLNMKANGAVNAIDLTVSHATGVEIITGKAWNTFTSAIDENSTRIIILEPADEMILSADANFTVEQVEAVSMENNVAVYIDASLIQPTEVRVTAAYPNPFNPSTNISLTLDQASNVSVSVYNVMGQLVDVIAEGNFAANTYNLSWDAQSFSSGVYFIRTQVDGYVDNQKVMLMK